MVMPDYVLKAIEERKGAGGIGEPHPDLPDYVKAAVLAKGNSPELINNTPEEQKAAFIKAESAPPITQPPLLRSPLKLAEPVLNAVTGGASAAVGGLVGLGTILKGAYDNGFQGANDAVDKAASRVQTIQKAGTYQPMSDYGKQVTNALGTAIEIPTQGWGNIGSQIGGAIAGDTGAAAGQALGEGGFQSALLLSGKPWEMGKPSVVTPERLQSQLSKAVKTGVDKGLKPVLPKGDPAKTYNTLEQGVRSIVENKNSLALKNLETGDTVTGLVPKNLEEGLQATAQRKADIFKTYDTLAQQATGQGAKVSLTPVVGRLIEISENPVIQDSFPGAAAYAATRAKAFAKRGEYSPDLTQKAIKKYNASLEAFQKNPNPEHTTQASIDAVILNNLRQGLDSTIESSTGQAYQPLKNEYGAVTELENALRRRKWQADQVSGKSTMNFYDVYGASDILSGIATGNPITALKGTALEGLSALIKKGKDPNRLVGKMFKSVDSITDKLPVKLPFESVAKDYNTNLEPQAALPAPPRDFKLVGEAAIPDESFQGMKSLPAPWKEQLLQIAHTPEGKQYLVEQLAKDTRYKALLNEVLQIPTTKALPAPPTQAILQTPEQTAAALRSPYNQIAQNALAPEQLLSDLNMLGRPSQINKASRNALSRGFPGNQRNR